MSKTSLGFAMTIIVATIFLIVLVHPSGAQVGTRSVDQYVSSAGQYAGTAKRGFESSRNGDTGAVAEGSGQSGASGGDSDSDAANDRGSSIAGDSQSADSDSGGSGSATERNIEEASEGEGTVAEISVEGTSEDEGGSVESSAGTSKYGPSSTLERLPDTGGPDATGLFWSVFSLLMLGSGASVVRVAADY